MNDRTLSCYIELSRGDRKLTGDETPLSGHPLNRLKVNRLDFFCLQNQPSFATGPIRHFISFSLRSPRLCLITITWKYRAATGTKLSQIIMGTAGTASIQILHLCLHSLVWLDLARRVWTWLGMARISYHSQAR